jgi:8-oxo-dGTP pyrophosphatase MutT (NUDIX family)
MNEPSWERLPDAARTIEANWLFRLRLERLRSRRTGREHGYYVMDLADCVNVIAVTPAREVVLVRQFRAGSGADSLETPGGLLDPGEDPAAAGARELLEETGYTGDRPRVLSTVWSLPSLLTSRATTIVIENARPTGTPRPDPGEELAVTLVPVERLPDLIRGGAIDHSLVVAGLLWWLSMGPADPAGGTSSVIDSMRNEHGRLSG